MRKGDLGIVKQGVGEWWGEGGVAVTFGLSPGLEEGEKVIVQGVHV